MTGQAPSTGAAGSQATSGLGLLTHYATGIILTQAFLLLPRRGNGRPSFPAGTAFGIASAALPLVVLSPSLGYGWFGLRSGDAARLDRIMLLGYSAFGVGIGLWAPRFAARRARAATVRFRCTANHRQESRPLDLGALIGSRRRVVDEVDVVGLTGSGGWRYPLRSWLGRGPKSGS